MEKLSILCWLPRYFIRPKNTDWRHGLFLYRSFSSRRDQYNITFTMRKSWAGVAWANWSYLKPALMHRLLRKKTLPVSDLATPVFKSDRLSKWDLIYAYGKFPKHSPKPVIWHTGPTDVNLLKIRGVSEAAIERQIHEKNKGVRQANLIAVSSVNAKIQFEKQFPDSRGRVEVLPFILPNVKVITQSELLRKHSSGPIRILFVGRQARLKGLAILVQAYKAIRTQFLDLEFIVVSNMSGGEVTLPPGTRYIREMSHPDVQALMRTAHIFAMPSWEDSFGLVYLEAFAAGAVVIAPDREPQRSLVCNGEAGCLVVPEIGSVAHCLRDLVQSRERRIALASKAMSEFSMKYAENIVLAEYEKIFRKAMKTEKA